MLISFLEFKYIPGVFFALSAGPFWVEDIFIFTLLRITILHFWKKYLEQSKANPVKLDRTRKRW